MNLAIVIGGCVLVCVAVIALISDNSQLFVLFDLNLVYTDMMIVITVAGVLIVFISFLGCYAAAVQEQNKFLLGTFFCLVLILFSVMGAITGAIMGCQSTVKTINTDLAESLAQYNDIEVVQKSWDFLQKNFECCGSNNSSDWAKVLGPNNVPRSCCMKDNEGNPGACSAGSNSYDNGCVEILIKFVTKNVQLFSVMALVVTIILLLAMIITCATIIHHLQMMNGNCFEIIRLRFQSVYV